MAIATGADVGREREAKGLTQETLSAMAGVSVRSIRRAEGGEPVSGETLRCLAAALDVPFEPVAAPEDPVERAARRLSSPVTPVQWAVCVGTSAVALSIPVLLMCMVAWPEFYMAARGIGDWAILATVLLQTLGASLGLAAGAYHDLAVAGHRPPTRAGTLRVSSWSAIVALTALGVQSLYFASLDPTGDAWTTIVRGAVSPGGFAMCLFLAFMAMRGFPSRELAYVARRERFLYGRVDRPAVK